MPQTLQQHEFQTPPTYAGQKLASWWQQAHAHERMAVLEDAEQLSGRDRVFRAWQAKMASPSLPRFTGPRDPDDWEQETPSHMIEVEADDDDDDMFRESAWHGARPDFDDDDDEYGEDWS